MGTAEAISAARRAGLDLVEVSPNANPPVCKILDFGKYRYELSKKDRESKKNTAATKVKELKFHINIDEHDYMVKMRHAEDFMMKGMKVKIAMVFRGREMMHQEIGHKLVKRIIEDLLHVGSADNTPKLIGKAINIMLTPHPIRKRVRKYTVEDEVLEEDGEVQEDAPSVNPDVNGTNN